ncbi:ABC-2 type transport system ATP-binding protein [Mariprofundus micogutta]|uniref:ABC-2 type transport system ATP-binding protein n=1 Tax=Mariprofundus micogutta TaxID=1921010 RepID=A0A1L8CQH2_9PROT|nr:ABC transporter ATP-binding protein [Mariprofundus micogutta]GAV21175.1 ABC-2 type transport system ATP-binding protein [Mariprofundus micogutta]
MRPEYLAVNKLSKQYGNNLVVKEVDLVIRRGEAIGLLGANGAGKSTLIKSILGLVHSSQGSVEINASSSYLPEQPQMPISLSALSLLKFKCKTNRLPPSSAQQALDDVQLSKQVRNQAMREYSKGMRQRTSLALALCGEPQLIILDEPMSGLDALGRAEILQLLQQRKSAGTAFLMSSHIVSDMVQLCDRVLIMASGRVCETVELHDHSLEEAKDLEVRLAQWSHRHE